jgi:hypothetical protein
VARFANSLSSSRELFFIGHSFGAQMGFRTFDEDSTIKGMVSLETSIEFKSEDSVIKEMWPEVYKKNFGCECKLSLSNSALCSYRQ